MICCLFVFVYQGISPCNAVPRIAWKQDLTFSCIKTKSRKPLLEIYTQKKKIQKSPGNPKNPINLANVPFVAIFYKILVIVLHAFLKNR